MGLPASSQPIDGHRQLEDETWFLSVVHAAYVNLSKTRTILKQSGPEDTESKPSFALGRASTGIEHT